MSRIVYPRALSNRRPARAARLAQVLNDAINQMGITAFLPFVTFAGIAVVLAIRSPTQSVSYQQALLLARENAQRLQDFEKLTGLEGEAAIADLQGAATYKQTLESVHLENARKNLAKETSEDFEHVSRTDRCEIIEGRLLDQVVNSMPDIPGQTKSRGALTKPTRNAARTAAAEDEPKWTAEAFAQALQRVDAGRTEARVLHERDRRQFDAAGQRLKVKEHLVACTKDFQDPPAAMDAARLLDAAVGPYLARDGELLNEADAALAKRVNGASLKATLATPAACLAGDVPEAVLRELAGLGVPDSKDDRGDKTRAAAEEAIARWRKGEARRHDAVLAKLVAGLGNDAVGVLDAGARNDRARLVAEARARISAIRDLKALPPQWETAFPDTARAVERRADQFTDHQSQQWAQEFESLVARVKDGTVALPDQDRLVADVSNAKEAERLKLATEAAAQIVTQNAAAPSEAEMRRLVDAVARRAAGIGEKRSAEFETKLRTAESTPSCTSLPPGGLSDRDALERRITEELVGQCGGDPRLDRSRNAAQARAKVLVDGLVKATGDRLLRDAAAWFAGAAQRETAHTLQDAAMAATAAERLLGEFFAPAAGTAPRDYLSAAQAPRELREKIKELAAKALADRRSALSDAALRAVEEGWAAATAGFDALTLETLADKRGQAACDEACRLLQRTVDEKVAGGWAMVEVSVRGRDRIRDALDRRRETLSNELFAAALEKAALPEDRWTSADELARIRPLRSDPASQKVAALAREELLKSVRAAGWTGTATPQTDRLAADRALALLLQRRKDLAETQLTAVRAKEQTVATTALDGESIEKILDRDVDAVVAAADLKPALEEVVAEIRRMRTERARIAKKAVEDARARVVELQRRLQQVTTARPDDGTHTGTRPVSGVVVADGLTAEQLDKLAARFQRDIAAEELRALIEPAAAVVKIDLTWMGSVLESDIKYFDEGTRTSQDVRRLKELSGWILGAAGLPPAHDVAVARQIADECAVKRYREAMEAAVASGNRTREDDRGADAAFAPFKREFRDAFERDFADKASPLLGANPKEISTRAETWIARAGPLSDGARERLRQMLADEAMSLQRDATHRVEGEIWTWQGERAQDDPEVKRVITAMLATSQGARSTQELIDAICEALRKRYDGNRDRLAQLGRELERCARGIAPQVIAANVPAPSAAKGQSPVRPPVPGAGGSGVGASSGNAPDNPPPSTTPTPNTPAKQPPTRPTPAASPPPDPELVITVSQPRPDKSNGQFVIAEYVREKNELVNVVTFEAPLGDGNLESFERALREIDDKLRREGFLGTAVRSVRTGRWATTKHFYVHVRTCGDSLPQGLGPRFPKLVSDAVTDFQDIAVEFRTASMWSSDAKTRKYVSFGQEADAPLEPK